MEKNRESIKRVLLNILDTDTTTLMEIGDEEDLGTYGLNSISSIKLIVLLEEEYGIVFEDVDLLMYKVNTINKIKEVLDKYVS